MLVFLEYIERAAIDDAGGDRCIDGAERFAFERLADLRRDTLGDGSS